MRILALVITLTLTALVSLILFLHWADRRDGGLLLSDLRPLEVAGTGEATPTPQLLAIDTRLIPADYQSPERLHLKFHSHLQRARERGLLRAGTAVVLPAHAGTGLFAAGEKIEVQQARTLRDAMQWMALSNPFNYLDAMLSSQAEDRRTEAVLRMKARVMAKDYQRVFGSLAQEFQVLLVAGSIVLPEPRIVDGRLLAGRGPLRQVAVAFAPNGEALEPLIHKMQPSRYERRFTSPPDEWAHQPIVGPGGPIDIFLGCPRTAQPLKEPAVLLGASAADCSVDAAHRPLYLPSAGLPWNLLGSPRKPDRTERQGPGRLISIPIDQTYDIRP